MNTKSIIVTILITLIAGILVIISNIKDKLYESISTYYKVYLNGKNIGIIDSEDKLYKLIDNNQSEIKEKYNVDTVYPPTNLKILKTNTYMDELDTVEEVYNKIEEDENFAIKGYVVKITKNDGTEFNINILDKEVLYNSARRFVKAFLNEDEYEEYINNEQEEIVETGRFIENMKFAENISIKEDYIDVNETIYTNDLELTHFLLFGNKPESKTYKVKLGDTIESISEANKLNVEEFLIANTNYKSQDTLLRVGDKVNVTLIDPQITFVYDLYEVEDEIVYFEKESVTDNTKAYGYSEITTPGQNGINRQKVSYSVTNGERSQTAEVTHIATIREVVNQVTTKGPRYPGTSGTIDPVNITGDWGWTTNKGYVITSYWGWRWGKMHNGIDISGAGNLGSPIYAAGDGVVTYVYAGCPSSGNGYGDPCGGGMGNMITIKHENGYYTKYGHMHQKIEVSVGDSVKKGQRIGSMGNSGSSTGPHIHFAVSKDTEYNYFNPMSLYK
ncbi:MAG: M23 family metallopeptidase [Firmicutes bacterium]|nr:M23 family metallopeptidase [Bacillota bacterium]